MEEEDDDDEGPQKCCSNRETSRIEITDLGR
jgi:hypothetical protein